MDRQLQGPYTSVAQCAIRDFEGHGMPEFEDLLQGDIKDADSNIRTTLDLRHLRCPMPVLRTRKALAGLRSGSSLIVECTDPMAGIDIPHLVNQTGDTLLTVEQRDGVQIFSIRKN